MRTIDELVQRDRVVSILGDCIWGDVWNRLADKTTLTENQRDDICHAAKNAAREKYDEIMEQEK